MGTGKNMVPTFGGAAGQEKRLSPQPAYSVFVSRAITNEKLLPHRLPDRAELGGEISLFACPGEIEPGTFSVYSSQDLKGVRVTVAPMTRNGARVSGAPAVDVRVVKCWYQAGRGITDTTHKLLTPELLLKDDDLVRVDLKTRENFLRTVDADGRAMYVPISTKDSAHLANVAPRDAETLQPVHIPANFLKQFWVTVQVPEQAAPGEYRGALHIQPEGLPGKELPLNVNVLPFNLAPPKLIYALYYRGKLTRDGKGSISSEWKSPEQYLAEMKNMAAHGVLYPTVYQPYDEKLLRRIFKLRDKAGLPKGILFNLGHRWGPFKPEELEGLKADVSKWRSLCAEHGYNEVYFYGVDEAKGERLKAQRPAWQAIHEAGGKTFVACFKSANAFESMGDLLDVAIFCGAPDSDEAGKYHKLGHRIFSYANPQVGVEEPETYRRNYGLLLWKSGFDGAMDYAYQGFHNHIWNDFDHPRYRNHVFAYPTVNGVIDTVQWEGFREGVDDVRYVTTLEKAIAAAKAFGNKAAAKLAAESEMWLGKLDIEGDLQALRLDMAQRIIKLNKAMKQ